MSSQQSGEKCCTTSVMSGSAGLSAEYRKALEEMEQCVGDIRGHPPEKRNKPLSPEQEKAILPAAIERVKAAIHRIPNIGDRRTDYDEAVEKVPHLVEIESPMDRYLRALNYDAELAAEQIVLFWKKRKQVFGDRALRPMTITGRGSLTKEHIYSALCGAFRIMPPDQNQRPVFFIDRAKFLTDAEDPQHRLQIIFYFLYLLFMESDLALTNGYVILLSMDNEANSKLFDFPSPEPSLWSHFVQEPGIPLQIKGIHMIFLKKSTFYEKSIPEWLQLYEPYPHLRHRVIAHVVFSRLEILLGLEAYGLTNANIPRELNGPVDLDAVGKWHADRLEIELKRYRYFPMLEQDDDSADDDTGSSFDDDDDHMDDDWDAEKVGALKDDESS